MGIGCIETLIHAAFVVLQVQDMTPTDKENTTGGSTFDLYNRKVIQRLKIPALLWNNRSETIDINGKFMTKEHTWC